MKRAEFTIFYGDIKIQGEVKYDLPPLRSVREVIREKKGPRPTSEWQRKPTQQLIDELLRQGYTREGINSMTYDQAYRRAKGLMKHPGRVSDRVRAKLLEMGYSQGEIDNFTPSQANKRARGVTKFVNVKR